MTTTEPARSGRHVPGNPFGDVLCGVDGGRADSETATQAALLAGAGRLTLVAIADRVGVGLSAQATLTPEHAQFALDDARRAAVEAGQADPRTKVIESSSAAAALLEQAEHRDLIVVGGNRISRAGGIAIGSTASALVHRARVPVLVARRPPRNEHFPGRLLLASDGSESSEEAAHLTAAIAAEHGCVVTVLCVGEERGSDARKRLAAQTAEIYAATGVEPVTIRERGSPHRRIEELAERERVSLVVVGSRGVGGLKALGSVSERVVHGVRCSVLVARRLR